MNRLAEWGWRRRAQLVCAGLIVATAAVYGRTLGHGFVSFDDNVYVYGNAVVLKGLSREGLGWAFTAFYGSNWHPLTWLSHMLDVSLFGTWAGGHHLTSVALHAVNAVLLFQVLRKGTGATGRSALVAALFCLHPLHVESVAWIAERKDVLSTCFGLLSLLAWVSFARRPSAARFLAALLAFALSLLAKPMLVTLPFVLLLLDVWPLERTRTTSWRRLAAEKIPFLALALASMGATLAAQRRAIASLAVVPLGMRTENALVAYVDYLVKTAWPAGLSYFYPFDSDALAWRALASALVLLAVSISIAKAARAKPFLAVGWLWYLGTLVPVIGIVQVGSQAMADRYTYFPLIGIFVAGVWSIPGPLLDTNPRRTGAVVAACLCALGFASWRQAGYWRSGISLYQHALDVDPDNWAALSNLGGELLLRDEPAAAALALSESIRLRPENPLAHAGLGLALEQEGKLAEAVESLRRAVQLQPRNAALYLDLGRLLEKTGHAEDSRAALEEARRLGAPPAGR